MVDIRIKKVDVDFDFFYLQETWFKCLCIPFENFFMTKMIRKMQGSNPQPPE